MSKRVFITPFNFEAITLYHKLIKTGLEVDGFMDANPYLWGKEYKSVGIFPRFFVADAKVIITAHASYQNVRNELLSLGYANDQIIKGNNYNVNIADYEIINDYDIPVIQDLITDRDLKSNFFIENIKKRRLISSFLDKPNDSIYGEYETDLYRKELLIDKDGIKRIILKQFEVIVTSMCSLKCEKCSAGMQYFKKPEHVPTEQIIKDYNRMIELIDWTDRVIIMGGETFLFPELDVVINAILQNPLTYSKTDGIKILTNGTVIPKQNVLEAMANKKVTVWISNYKDKSWKLFELCDTLRKYGIRYRVLEMPSWSNVNQYVDAKIPNSEEVLLQRRKKDCGTRCRTICNGKFYLCSFLKTMDALGMTPGFDGKYVGLYSPNAKNEIVDMLDMEQPLPVACSWCNGCSADAWSNALTPVAKQTAKPLDYTEYH